MSFAVDNDDGSGSGSGSGNNDKFRPALWIIRDVCLHRGCLRLFRSTVECAVCIKIWQLHVFFIIYLKIVYGINTELPECSRAWYTLSKGGGKYIRLHYIHTYIHQKLTELTFFRQLTNSVTVFFWPVGIHFSSLTVNSFTKFVFPWRPTNCIQKPYAHICNCIT